MRIVARDASQARWRAVSLLEYFDEKDVLEALKKDAFLSRILGPSAPLAAIGTLQALADVLVRAQSTRVHAGPADHCADEFSVGGADTFLYSFAFHHLDGGMIAVRIGLKGNGDECVDHLKQLGILLPIPPKLRSQLEAAANGTEGFLMARRAKPGAPKFTRECSFSVKELVERAEASGR